MPQRISALFEKTQREGRSAFIAYVCAGDPTPGRGFAACKALIDAGVDMLELGVPFSDPLADGLTNQLAAQRALESGANHDTVFQQVREIRAYAPDLPIVFYTYYNLVFSQGEEAYVKMAKDAGVDGILMLDLPPEEAGTFLEICRSHAMDTVFIVAPTTPETRVKTICDATTGFVYYVSRAGVTGERASLVSDLSERVALIREHTDLPVSVGFGISKPEHVKAVGEIADGVIVGSALVNCIGANAGDQEALVSALGDKAKTLLSGIGR
ncbi:MAG: tryptophan synthase subunit alpha [Verrucomicrobiota bacterium]